MNDARENAYPYTALMPAPPCLVAHFVKANSAVLAAGRQIMAHEKEHGRDASLDIGDQLTIYHFPVIGMGQRGNELDLLIADSRGNVITKWGGDTVGGFFCGLTDDTEPPLLVEMRAVCVEVSDHLDHVDSRGHVNLTAKSEVEITNAVLSLAIRGFFASSSILDGATSSIYPEYVEVDEDDDA